MVKFIIIMLLVLITALVLIDIFNAIKYRNERVRAGIEIAKVKASYISATESATRANRRIYELKRALNEQGISTDYISVERLKEPEKEEEEVRSIDGSYISNN
jgi:hypothetical protein